MFQRSAEAISRADGLLITAGAGMGVDSGLPDFRGTTGFWQAYPALAKAGIDFQDIANPADFRANSRRAWGFYGHRLNLYRHTVPHEGFAILRRLGETMHKGMVVIEIGAGSHIPTARNFGARQQGFLIRINPTEPELGDATGVSLRMGGLAALQGIEEMLKYLEQTSGAQKSNAAS